MLKIPDSISHTLAQYLFIVSFRYVSENGFPKNLSVVSFFWASFAHSIRDVLEERGELYSLQNEFIPTLSAFFEIPMTDVERLADLKKTQRSTMRALADFETSHEKKVEAIHILAAFSVFFDRDIYEDEDRTLPPMNQILNLSSCLVDVMKYTLKLFSTHPDGSLPVHPQAIKEDPQVKNEDPQTNTEEPQSSKKEPLRINWAIPISIFTCVLVIVLFVFASNKDDLSPSKPPASTQSIDTKVETTVAPTQKPTEKNTLKSLPLPSNGKILKKPSGRMVAPLTIETDSTESCNYYFVLTPVGSKDVVMSFFVRGGRSAEVSVPLGTYRIFYATGYDWFGTDDLFGPDTSYQQCGGTFSFTEDYDGYVGWTLTMKSVYNGNMDTFGVSEDDFPK